MRDLWHIHNVNWLDKLSAKDREMLEERAKRRNFAAGETIFTPTRAAKSVYLLERGRARIYRLSRDGMETTFGYIMPGEVFGELAAFDHSVRESYAEAVEDLSVWKIPLETFERLLGSYPDVSIEITKQVGERLRLVESRVADLAFRNARTRLAGCLLQLMDRFGFSEVEGQGHRLKLHLNQTELAQLIGSTRQTVNVSLRELEEEGLVIRGSRKTILRDPEALRRRIELESGV